MIGAVVWWLSFVDPDLPKGERFLGACLVKALPARPQEALAEAWAQRCNPGGEVMFSEFPGDMPVPDVVFARYGNRLLSRAECQEFDAVMSATYGPGSDSTQ